MDCFGKFSIFSMSGEAILTALGILSGLILTHLIALPIRLRVPTCYIFWAIFRHWRSFVLLLIQTAGLTVIVSILRLGVDAATSLQPGCIIVFILSLIIGVSVALTHPKPIESIDPEGRLVSLIGRSQGPLRRLLRNSIERGLMNELDADSEKLHDGEGYWRPRVTIKPKEVMRRFRVLYAKEKQTMAKKYNSRAILNQNPGNEAAQFRVLVDHIGRSKLRAIVCGDTPKLSIGGWRGRERRSKSRLHGTIKNRKSKRKNPNLRNHEDERLIQSLFPTDEGSLTKEPSSRSAND